MPSVLSSVVMFVVLTGDIVASGRVRDREGLLERLVEAMGFLTGRLSPWVLSPFRVVRGDEFQGLLSALFPVPMALLELKVRLRPFRVRVGVGQGELSTRVMEDVSLMDGEAFRRAAEALRIAKAERREVVFRTGMGQVDEVAGMLYPLMEALWGRWRDELWRRFGLLLEGRGLKEIAREVGVSYQAVHRDFQRGGVMRVLEATRGFERWLEGQGG